MLEGSRRDGASTALLRRVILESDPQQVIRRLSLWVSAAVSRHGLPPPSSASAHPPRPLCSPGPGAGGVRLHPLRLPGGGLGAEGRGWPQIGSTEGVQTLPRAGGLAGRAGAGVWPRPQSSRLWQPPEAPCQVSIPPPALIISREKLSANEGELLCRSCSLPARTSHK